MIVLLAAIRLVEMELEVEADLASDRTSAGNLAVIGPSMILSIFIYMVTAMEGTATAITAEIIIEVATDPAQVPLGTAVVRMPKQEVEVLVHESPAAHFPNIHLLPPPPPQPQETSFQATRPSSPSLLSQR